MAHTKSSKARIIRGATAIAIIVACSSIILAQKPKRPKARPKVPAPGVAAVVAPAPFNAGENFGHRVLFSKYSVNAAKNETSVFEQGPFFGHLPWNFRPSAHRRETPRIPLEI